MRTQTVTLSLSNSSVNCLAAAQSLAGAGNVTLNGSSVTGGVGTLSATNCTGRRVLLTSAANDSTLTWTISGTSPAGYAQTETLAGGNTAAVTSGGDYATVTTIAASKATAGNITIGTSGVGSTGWKALNTFEGPYNVNFQTNLVSGSANWTIQYTLDQDIATSSNLPGINAWNLAAITSASASTGSATTGPITAWRLLINSGTGKVVAQAVQSGGGNT